MLIALLKKNLVIFEKSTLQDKKVASFDFEIKHNISDDLKFIKVEVTDLIMPDT